MGKRSTVVSGSLFGLLAAATFGTSGSFASALMDTGWSSGAAVTARISVAAVLLTIPATLQLRGRWQALWRERWSMLLYGLVAVAGCQLFYFNAVSHLSVGVALMLEYSGTVLVVLWLWATQGRRPSPLTATGIVASVAGLVIVLQVWNEKKLDLIGLAWGLGAAIGLAVFFVIAARTTSEVPPLASAWAGMTIGAVTLGAAGIAGALPVRANTKPVHLAGHQVSWVIAVLGLALIAAAIAYCFGMEAARRLGATVASFFGLTEVLFAVLFAWLLLSQAPSMLQAVGGVVVVAGIALVQAGERTESTVTAEAEIVPAREARPPVDPSVAGSLAI